MNIISYEYVILLSPADKCHRVYLIHSGTEPIRNACARARHWIKIISKISSIEIIYNLNASACLVITLFNFKCYTDFAFNIIIIQTRLYIRNIKCTPLRSLHIRVYNTHSARFFFPGRSPLRLREKKRNKRPYALTRGKSICIFKRGSPLSSPVCNTRTRARVSALDKALRARAGHANEELCNRIKLYAVANHPLRVRVCVCLLSKLSGARGRG